MSNWQSMTLGDVCTMRRGISYSGSEVRDAEGIPFVTIKAFKKGGGFSSAGLKYFSGADVPSHRVKAGDLLIANTDVTRDAEIIGAPVLIPKLVDDPLFSMDVNQLALTRESVSSRFLFYLLCTEQAREYMKGHSAGSTVLHLHVKDVPAFRFDLPPQQEQDKIVQILDTLDTQIRQTEVLIAKLERIKQGLLTDLLTRGIDQNGQLRPPPEEAPDLYKDSLLGPVPCDWRVVRSIEAVEVKNPNRRVDETSCSSGGKTPILNQSKSGFLGWTDLSPDISASRNEPYVTFANHTCAVRWVDFDCCAIQNVFFLRGATETSTRFLYYALDGRIPQQSYQGHWPLLKESYLCLPSFTEQCRIAKSLDSLHGRSKTERNKLRELKAIRAGLMDDLLTGRVRVTPLLETTERATV